MKHDNNDDSNNQKINLRGGEEQNRTGNGESNKQKTASNMQLRAIQSTTKQKIHKATNEKKKESRMRHHNMERESVYIHTYTHTHTHI